MGVKRDGLPFLGGTCAEWSFRFSGSRVALDLGNCRREEIGGLATRLGFAEAALGLMVLLHDLGLVILAARGFPESFVVVGCGSVENRAASEN
jgi:hypothetical protein